MTLQIFGSSVIGPHHILKKLPCQDACAFSSARSGLGVIAVADGLGSASKSETGANLAVAAAVASIAEAFEIVELVETSLEHVVVTAVQHARETLEQKAANEEWCLQDLACTLIVVAFQGSCLAVAHVGDGAVVAQIGNDLHLISGPSESEYSNEVVPLTTSSWQESLRTIRMTSDVKCLAVFTDGCQRAAFRKLGNRLEPFDGFFGPIFSYACGLTDLAEGQREINALLSSRKMCENSEDDKTLVVAVLDRG